MLILLIKHIKLLYQLTSLTPFLFIEVPVPSQESKLSYIYVLEISILPLSTIFLLEFGNADGSFSSQQ
jgi:hypothetical protein